MARVLLEIHESGSATAIGSIINVITASWDQAVSEIGNWEASISALDPNISLLTHGREIHIYLEGKEEPEFRGELQILDWSFENDEPILMIGGPSIAVELIYQNTYRAVVFRDASILDVYESLLLNTGWSGAYSQVLEDIEQTVTRRMDNLTIWEALKDIADLHGGYLRETFSPRVIEVSGSHEPTGILLTNQESITQPQGQPIGIISQLRSVRQDSTSLYNRIIPFGKIDGHDYFDLRTATRSISNGDPYDVEMLIAGHPEVANTEDDQFTASIDPEVLEEHFLDVEVTGIDRAVMSVFFTNGSNGGGNLFPINPRWNGVDTGNLGLGGTTYVPEDDLSIRASLWQFTTPGVNKLTWLYASNAPDTPADFRVVGVAFQNIDRYLSLFPKQTNTGTGTSASTNITSVSEKYLLVDMIITNPNVTLTPGAGQDEIFQEDITGTSYRCAMSVKSGSPTGSDSMSWSLSGSADWAHVVWALRGAPNYYLEDATSVATYGVRAKPVAMGEYKLINLSQMPEAANSLYDKTVSYLQNHKDPAYFYELEVENMPEIPWLVGDSFQVKYGGVLGGQEFLDIEDNFLICVKRRANVDADGILKWDLTLSTRAMVKRELDELLSQLFIRLDSVQSGQV